MQSLEELRQILHANPYPSGKEHETAGIISRYFDSLNPDRVVDGIGGTGIAYMFAGASNGPTVLLRCELDAIPESGRSAHRCGHDGHMAIVAGVGSAISKRRPSSGRVVLLFQPAEETGRGARAVIDDPRFRNVAPDYAFALHNLPGFPMGSIIVREGSFASASRGMVVTLRGKPAHAAEPEKGISPAHSMCRLIEKLETLPAHITATRESMMVTVVGARMGGKTFGVAPGDAEVMATLRAETDEGMKQLVRKAEDLTAGEASANELGYTIGYEDIFPATKNSPAAVEIVRRAAGTATGIGPNTPVIVSPERPFTWSEDFGHFTAICEGSLFGLGAGEHTSSLHSNEYEFPDELIPVGVGIFSRIVCDILG